MAFKSIGTLAGDVLLKAKAARANQVALKFEADAQGHREDRAGHPPAQSALEPDAQLLKGEGATVSNGGLVTRASGDQHASGVRGSRIQQTKSRSAFSLQSLPTIGRCERIAIPRPGAISPVAAMRSHLLIEWLRHASAPSGWRTVRNLRN